MSSPTKPPPGSGVDFLDWVRVRTEAAWRVAAELTLRDYENRGTGGSHWRRGTRWIGGYTEAEIDAFEQREKLQFPLDFRLFLRRLGCTDRPRGGAYFLDESRMAERESPGFYDWRDAPQIAAARENVFDGLLFDVEHNALWEEDWGARPDDPNSRELELRRHFEAAPRLAPLFEHRFLLVQPPNAGNPVLSIHQSDIIVYGRDLRTYLLNELAELESEPDFGDAKSAERASIPFWGHFL